MATSVLPRAAVCTETRRISWPQAIIWGCSVVASVGIAYAASIQITPEGASLATAAAIIPVMPSARRMITTPLVALWTAVCVFALVIVDDPPPIEKPRRKV